VLREEPRLGRSCCREDEHGGGNGA